MIQQSVKDSVLPAEHLSKQPKTRAVSRIILDKAYALN